MLSLIDYEVSWDREDEGTNLVESLINNSISAFRQEVEIFLSMMTQRMIIMKP